MPKAGRGTLPSCAYHIAGRLLALFREAEGQGGARNIFLYLVFNSLRALDGVCTYVCAMMLC